MPLVLAMLRAYLGLLTNYSNFLPNMVTVLAPLYELPWKDTPWKSPDVEEKALCATKDVLTHQHCWSISTLTLMCDASSYGVGAVLAHCMPDGSEHPIGYASHGCVMWESPLQPRKWPSRPWVRLHMDFAGPIHG